MNGCRNWEIRRVEKIAFRIVRVTAYNYDAKVHTDSVFTQFKITHSQNTLSQTHISIPQNGKVRKKKLIKIYDSNDIEKSTHLRRLFRAVYLRSSK